MSSYVYTILRITGPKLDRDRLQAQVTGDSAFDLNKIVPMPLELQNLRSGLQIINGVRFSSWVEREGKNVGLTPEETRSLLKRFGETTRHDWAWRNWGTKLNTQDVEDVGVRDAELEYRFETAWETPYEALKRLSAIYPRLRFCVETSGDVDHKEMFKLKNGMQS